MSVIQVREQATPVQLSSTGLAVLLSQLPDNLSTRTGRIADPGNQLAQVTETLTLSARHQPTPDFFLFPEVALPLSSVPDLLAIVRQDAIPVNTFTLIGLEIASVENIRSLINTHGIRSSATQGELKRAHSNVPVNAALIIAKGETQEPVCYLQFKLTASRFEGSLDKLNSLYTSHGVLHFTAGEVSFITLVCSDFFNHPDPSKSTRIIDTINHHFDVSSKVVPDFIFNLQYNFSPDNHRFMRALRRIYDEEYGYHSQVCTILLNTAGLQGDHGGLSKILFHRDSPIPLDPRLKQKRVAAPVVGFELPNKPLSVLASFSRSPKDWRKDADDWFPVRLTCWLDGEPVESSAAGISYVSEAPREVTLDYQTYEEVARRLSQIGQYSEAAEWALRAQGYWKDRHDYLRLAQNSHFVGNQYRHIGDLRSSLHHYSQAMAQIYQLDPSPGPEQFFVRWRLEAATKMVQDFLSKADLVASLRSFRRLTDEVRDYLAEEPTLPEEWRSQLRLYICHSLRQQAEIRRLLGQYRWSQKLFNWLYMSYSYVQGTPKAYALLGEAEALRMRGYYPQAETRLREVRDYASHHGDMRLHARVLRALIPLRHAAGETSEVLEDLQLELYRTSVKANYRFGIIYSKLLGAMIKLPEDPSTAKEEILDARGTAQDATQEPVRLEEAHAQLALAECSRMIEEFEEASRKYLEAWEIYRSSGHFWGKVRCAVGQGMLGNRDLLDQLPTIRASRHPLEADLLNTMHDYHRETTQPSTAPVELLTNLP